MQNAREAILGDLVDEKSRKWGDQPKSGFPSTSISISPMGRLSNG